VTRLTDELKGQILVELHAEPSDTKLAAKYGVSRKTIWRLRQGPAPLKPAIQMPAVKVPDPPRASAMPDEITPPPSPIAIATSVTVPPVPPVPTAEMGSLKDPPPTRLARPRSRSDIRPKVDVGPSFLNTYFAVQLLRGEDYAQVAFLVLNEAQKLGVLFRKLQVLDVASVGGSMFVRFRSDVDDAHKVVCGLLERAIITQGVDGGYYANYPSGRTGKYPTSAMCVGPKVGFGRMFVGTRIRRWRQQFAA
jgi:hypothetical protein